MTVAYLDAVDQKGTAAVEKNAILLEVRLRPMIMTAMEESIAVFLAQNVNQLEK